MGRAHRKRIQNKNGSKGLDVEIEASSLVLCTANGVMEHLPC